MNKSLLAAALASAFAMPAIGVKVAFSGEVRCVLNQGTEQEQDTGWFHNLITDIGLDRLAVVSPTIMSFTSIGTGTTAPTISNTSLQSYVASTGSPILDSTTNDGPAAYTAQFQCHWVYPQGAVVGNMAEVGFGWATGGVNLWSRALILDGGGSPTTLTVTSIDQLTVYYKLTCTPQITDLTGSFALSAETYDYTGRLANAANFCNNLYGQLQGGSGRWGKAESASGACVTSYSTQTLGAITSNPSGTSSNGGTNGGVTLGSYTPGQKYLESTIPITPAQCNSAGGIGSMLIHFGLSQAQFQYSFANQVGGTVIPKDNTKTMSLVVRYSWDRV